MSSRLVRSIGAIGAIGAVTVGVAACGGSSSASTASSTPAASSVAAKAKTAVAEKAGAEGASTAPSASAAPEKAGAEGASTAPSASASTTAAATTVPVTLGTPTEFTLTLGVSAIPAGKVTFKVTNGGKMAHEFSILKTTTPGANLKVTNGQADETGSIAETGDMAAGAVKSLTVDLKPGHYVVLCNLPGHYQGGMWKNMTVS